MRNCSCVRNRAYAYCSHAPELATSRSRRGCPSLDTREEAIPLDQIKRVTVCVTYEGGEERRHTIAGGDLPAVLLRMLLALL